MRLVYTHPNTRALARFFRYVNVTKSGCWEWVGSTSNSGYGMFGWNYVATTAHRVAFWWFDRMPSKSEVVDHLCRNIRCVNPAHLEAVSQSQNVQRGRGGVPKTHCRRGHALTVDNVFMQRRYSELMRTCLQCRRMRETLRRAKRLELRRSA